MNVSLIRSTLAAAIAGAVTVFVWGGFSHMVLLIGVGFSRLPAEDRVVTELRSSISDDGLYFFPGTDLRGDPSADERAEFAARFRAGPHGLVIFHPAGDEPLSPRKLVVQAASDMIAALIAAALMASMATTSFWRRVLAISSLGAFSGLAVSTIYWNWYGFPDAFFLAQMIDLVVGWTLAGVAMAAVFRSRWALR